MRPIVVSAYGVKVRVELTNQALFEAFERESILPDWKLEADSAQTELFIRGAKLDGRYVLDGTTISYHNSDSLDFTLNVVESSLANLWGRYSKEMVFVDGGVVDYQAHRIGFFHSSIQAGIPQLLSACVRTGAELFSGRKLVLSRRQLTPQSYPCIVGFYSDDKIFLRERGPSKLLDRGPLTDLVLLRPGAKQHARLEPAPSQARLVSALQNSTYPAKPAHLPILTRIVQACRVWEFNCDTAKIDAEQLLVEISRAKGQDTSGSSAIKNRK